MYKILLFGITKDIIGNSELLLASTSPIKVQQLLEVIKEEYPGLKSLKSLLVAVNSEYATHEQEITHNDEIALIPPVSGG